MAGTAAAMTEWPLVKDIVADVQAGRRRAVDLVEQSLAAIAASQDYESIISVLEESAREQAKDIDRRVANGEKVGRLAGVPFVAKDNFLTLGGQTTAASNILRDFKAPYQATAINRLEAEGAICVAKANLDAFAHGSSTENSDFMVTKNPHNKDYVPGGSSGGSAAAVVLGIAPFALGTDTGGSIRLPAAFTGSVGLKPTYGLVSRSGVVAMASSTDVIGPLTTNVADAALVLDILAGRDPLDSTTIERQPSYLIESPSQDLQGVKIGLVKEYLDEAVDPAVKKLIEATAEQLKKAGATVKELSLPSLPLALASYYIICPAEISSNLSRYDGQHFGYSSPEANDLEDSFSLTRSQGLGHEAKKRILIGTYVLSSGYYDAYYQRAQQLRTKLIEEFAAAFKEVDFLLGPTAPSTAFKIGEHNHHPLKMYLTDIMTVAANLTGIPALSLPVGQIDGLPVGLQIMAAQRHDKQLLALASSVEAVLSHSHGKALERAKRSRND